MRLQEAAREIYVDGLVREYIVGLAEASRNHQDVALGASPRASLGMFRMARAYALVQNRDYVVPDDVQALAYGGHGPPHHTLARRPYAPPATPRGRRPPAGLGASPRGRALEEQMPIHPRAQLAYNPQLTASANGSARVDAAQIPHSAFETAGSDCPSRSCSYYWRLPPAAEKNRPLQHRPVTPAGTTTRVAPTDTPEPTATLPTTPTTTPTVGAHSRAPTLAPTTPPTDPPEPTLRPRRRRSRNRRWHLPRRNRRLRSNPRPRLRPRRNRRLRLSQRRPPMSLWNHAKGPRAASSATARRSSPGRRVGQQPAAVDGEPARQGGAD